MADTLTTRDLQQRVDQGVAWLDKHHPNWWRADRPDHGPERPGPIDLDELSMGHPCYCVLGQILGNYYQAPIELDQAVRCGFDTAAIAEYPEITDANYDEFKAATAEEFAALGQLWRRVIAARRAEAVTHA